MIPFIGAPAGARANVEGAAHSRPFYGCYDPSPIVQ
jgi:hypothetical protein